MTEASSADSGAGEQTCEHCGAQLAEIVTACPFCGARMSTLASLEEETRVFLDSTGIRLADAVADYPDGLLAVALFGFLVSGPACYLLLDSHTDLGVLARIGLAVLAWFAAFLLFGWQVSRRDERAQRHAWRTVVQPAVRDFLARKGFSDSEFLTLVRRLLAEDSRLRTMLLRHPRSLAAK